MNRTSTLLIALIFFNLLALVLNIGLGSVSISISDILGSLSGSEKVDAVLTGIVLEFRLPRGLTAMLAGSALSVSGLMMQTVFRNPLADPFVLGVNGGASLGVAITLLVLAPSGIALTQDLRLSGHILVVVAASVGAGAVLMTLLAFARRVDVMSLLILGLMISYGVGAIVSILIFYSMADRLQSFFNWSFGNFSSVTWTHFLVFAPSVVVGLAAVVPQIKSLDAFLLGERYASSMGVNVRRSRILILGSASLLAGVVTGFCGPIGFVGIAAPHFCRLLFRAPSHRILVPSAILFGSLIALIADLIAKAPGIEATLPLNAVTALIGAPVVVAALLKQRNLRRVFGG